MAVGLICFPSSGSPWTASATFPVTPSWSNCLASQGCTFYTALCIGRFLTSYSAACRPALLWNPTYTNLLHHFIHATCIIPALPLASLIIVNTTTQLLKWKTWSPSSTPVALSFSDHRSHLCYVLNADSQAFPWNSHSGKLGFGWESVYQRVKWFLWLDRFGKLCSFLCLPN